MLNSVPQLFGLYLEILEITFIVWNMTFFCVSVHNEFADWPKFTSCFAAAWGFVLVVCCLQEERKHISPWTSKVMESHFHYHIQDYENINSVLSIMCSVSERSLLGFFSVLIIPHSCSGVKLQWVCNQILCIFFCGVLLCIRKLHQQCRYCLSEEWVRLVRHGD